MKRWLRPIVLFVVGAGLIGGIVLVSGIVPVKASSGHWPITRWFLEFSKMRSVSTHSLFMEVPELEDPGLILLGAGAYHTNCRMCHGSPGYRRPVVASAMTPDPPFLPDVLEKYTPSELFYIVQHGIKFAGMPAWPVRNREDEVWAVVAFLQQMPELDEEGYNALVWGEAAESLGPPAEGFGGLSTEQPRHLATCARCHARGGMGRGQPAFPILASQSKGYLLHALQAYASRERHSGIMQPVAALLTPDEMEALADYFSRQVRPSTPTQTFAHKLIAQGEEIALRGGPDGRIPSCVDCHSSDGAERREEYPLLHGQPSDYLLRQLELFKTGHRGGAEFAHLMHDVIPHLSPEQMKAVSAYFAATTPPK